MMIDQLGIQNRLLHFMSGQDFAALSPNLQSIDLPRGFVFVKAGEPQTFVYFPTSAIASQIAITPDATRLEVGIYGREGVGPTAAILGVDRSAYEHLIQVPGEGFRIRSTDFTDALRQSPLLQSFLLRYVQVANTQTAFTAVSNGSEVLGERLARWLLMCHDRLDSDDVALTHEFLSIMLGVRRSGVTDAIHLLEGVQIVKATRGNIRILDRKRLEQTAGDSYGIPEEEYRRLIGPLR